MSTAAPPFSELTAEDLGQRVGAIPLWRIRQEPPPGTATEEDVERVRREESRLCELIDGVLVEKAVSDESSGVGLEIGALLRNFVKPRRLGWVLGSDGHVRLFGKQLRVPDVSFVSRAQRPHGRLLSQGYADTAPALAVEVLGPGNTPGEMQRKRAEFFAAGTELFWIVDPNRQEIEVWTNIDRRHTVRGKDVLDGGSVLPGFAVTVADIFAELDLGPLSDEPQPPA